MKVEKYVSEPVFQPVKVVITVSTEDELDMLRTNLEMIADGNAAGTDSAFDDFCQTLHDQL